MFLTRRPFTGELGGRSGADAKFAAAATDGGPKGGFVAWLSGRDTSGALVKAADRIAEARYVLLNGKTAFESKEQLAAGPLNPIFITELGTPLAETEDHIKVWTGTLSSLRPSPVSRCRSD